MSVTSDEINYLVYRYLLESGFSHSTFAFQHETAIHRAEVKGSHVKPGALITLLQKGLQYMEVETHIKENGIEKRCVAPFTLLGPHQCQIVADDDLDDEDDDGYERLVFATNTKQPDVRREPKKNATTMTSTESKDDGQSNDAQMADLSLEVAPEDIRILTGHTSEVFALAWNQKYGLLATGAGDDTARIWDLENDGEAVVLAHDMVTDRGKHITALDWSPDGSLLATGGYDGIGRIWTKEGHLQFILQKHKGPIFALKWNKSGSLLVSASLDKSTIVWDSVTGEQRQQFEFHSLATMDVDWLDDSTFASGSTDSNVFVCQLGSLVPLQQLSGHSDGVNAVRWDPSGTYLATCSDDCTAKIWTVGNNNPVSTLSAHVKSVNTIRWLPVQNAYSTNVGDNTQSVIAEPSSSSSSSIEVNMAGEQSNTSSNQVVALATASLDGDVRIWDAVQGTCLHVFSFHRKAVYSLCFSPDGLYMASGSFDNSVGIWSLKERSVIKTYHGDSGVFEVGWNSRTNQIAAAFSGSIVAVLTPSFFNQ